MLNGIMLRTACAAPQVKASNQKGGENFTTMVPSTI